MTEPTSREMILADHRAQMGLLLHGHLLCGCNARFATALEWATHAISELGVES